MSAIETRRIVDDVGTLKAMADPTRMAVLEFLMSDPARTWTAKELAKHVGMPVTKLYYHLNQLEKARLVQVRDVNVVNGILEKQYGAGQERLSFHRGGTEDPTVVRDGINAIFERVHADINLGLESGSISTSREAPDSHRMLASQAIATITPEQAGEFRAELLALVERYRSASTAAGTPFQLLVALHPRAIAAES